MRIIRIRGKRLLSVLLAVMMILPTAAGSLAAFAANGEWVPVHYTTEYGFENVQAGTYYIVDGNYAFCYKNGALAVANISSGFDSATKWTIKKSTDGSFSFSSPIAVNADGANKYIITAASENTVYIQSSKGNYLYYNGSAFALSADPHELKLYDTSASTDYVYELDTDGIDAGAKYIIAGRSNPYAISYNGSGIAAFDITNYRSNRVTGISNELYRTITIPQSAYDNGSFNWTFSSGTGGRFKWDNDNRYMRSNRSSIGTTTTSSSSNFTVSPNVISEGRYTLKFTYSGTTYYLGYVDGAFSYSTEEKTLWLYKQVKVPSAGIPVITFSRDPNKTIETPDLWGWLDNCLVECDTDSNNSDVESIIRGTDDFRVYTSATANGSSSTLISRSSQNITFDFSRVNTSSAGTYSVPVKYNGYQLGTVDVQVNEKTPVRSAQLLEYSGSVYAYSPSAAETGASAQVIYENGTSKIVPITVDMLSGSFNISKAGTYTDLTVKIGDTTVSTNFTLTVLSPVGASSEFVKYTPNKSGQYVENGNYIIYNNRGSFVFSGSGASGGGLKGSTNFTINGDVITAPAAAVVTITATNTSNNYYSIKTSGGSYIRISSSEGQNAVSLGNSQNLKISVSNTYPQMVTIGESTGTYVLNDYGGNGSLVLGAYTGGFSDEGNRIVLYKEQVSDAYALTSTGCTIYAGDNFDINSIKDYTKVNITSGDGSVIKNTISLTNSRVSVSWADGFNKNAAGAYDAIITVDGIEVGTFTVNVVQPRAVTSIELLNYEGSVYVNSSANVSTGAYLSVNYEDGTSELKPITVSMLTGNYDLKTIDSYPNLTVTYLGRNVTDSFTLNVTGKNDYPEYPEQGSVRVDKTATASDFANNGVARVQLSATGVPMTPGIDIVMVLDTSSSMESYMGTYNNRDVFCEGTGTSSSWYYTDGSLVGITGSSNSNVTNKKSRHDVLQSSLGDFINALNAEGSDGRKRDVQISICDFNGYTQIDKTNDRLKNVSVISTTSDRSQVYTGDKKWDAGSFVPVESLVGNIPELAYNSGTNYDRAFEEAYTLVKAKKEQNEYNEEVREQYVIFMSDGGAFQFNYLTGNSTVSNNVYNQWNDWLNGTYNDYTEVPAYNSSTHAYFYNGPRNPNRIAEAIKGDPDKEYTIVDRTRKTGTVDVTGDGVADDYMHNVEGLGAKLYSIGYCITPDHTLTLESIKAALTHSATSDEYYYDANSVTELAGAFDSILNDLKQAGTDAYFIDTMGSCYDLQMSSRYMKNGVSYALNPAPSIVFTDYELYTNADYQKGIISDYNRIGTRTGKSTVREIVTFNEAGTEAYSNKLSGNILRDGVIRAKTFTYNLTTDPVDADVDDDGVMDITLDPETFVCKIGIVAELEYVLSYDVYLTGSMEGTREAGSYPTNESAVLYYTNYLDHPCHKDTVSPRLAWEAANISYEFYLVNADGKPVNTAGEVVPFSNRVFVGNIQTNEILLNNTVETNAEIKAADVIPEGYLLYSPNAKYILKIDSGSTPSAATITDGKNVAGSNTVSTFYYDAGVTYNKTGEIPNVVDYGNTHVAFAVLLVPSIIPDAVVIDYGLPVKISALANDLSIPAGTTINAISKTIPDGLVLNNQSYSSSQFTNGSKSLTYDHGTVTLNGDKVTYTPTDALMDKEDVIYYEVILNGKYYYSTITVYPAQNIYYEDDFFTFTPDSRWKTAGTRKADASQAEDRPGTFNLSAIDFNNVYGYDAVYDDTTVTYSLGSARYTTVSPDTPQSGASQPKAEFTFRGTGFDLFSVTSNETGYTLVQVFDESGELVENYSVQTYYGYSYDESDEMGFSPDTGARGGIYQIPIIRSRNLDYGTYNVVVQPMYSSWMDHQGRGSYDLYVDGIRIYDPAGSNPSEKIKKVYIEDSEADNRYVSLRSNVISANDFYKLSTTPEGLSGYGNFYPGIMFIDGIDKLGSSIDEAYEKYLRAGPNNELYLTKGQAIAFYLQIDGCHEVPSSIQLGMKVVGGGATGNVLLMNSAQSAPQKITVKGGAPRYYDITNAFAWNKSILSAVSQTGLKTMETGSFGSNTVEGNYSANEWTFSKTGSGWSLCNNSNASVTLTRTESSGIIASFAPAGTGDLFRVESTNGLFTFTNSSELSLSYNGVVVGSDYGGASFYIYKADGDVYTRVNSAEELEDGERYLIVYDGSTDMVVCPVTDVADSSTSTYRTLYPIVIMNSSDDTVSLTNFKITFDSYSAGSRPMMKMSSNAASSNFAENAVESFIINMKDYEEKAVDVSKITTEFVRDIDDEKVEGVLYVRTPSDISMITIGSDTVTEFTDNGDGSRTFAYTFYVGYIYDTATYTITVTDEDGNSEKIIRKGYHVLTAKEISDATEEDEEDYSKKPLTRALKSLLRIIIDYFRSIVRWFTSL